MEMVRLSPFACQRPLKVALLAKRPCKVPSLRKVTGKSKELVEALENAAHYKGDKNYLKLAPEAKNSYVQFGHYK